jgi:hypothetical protein
MLFIQSSSGPLESFVKTGQPEILVATLIVLLAILMVLVANRNKIDIEINNANENKQTANQDTKVNQGE